MLRALVLLSGLALSGTALSIEISHDALLEHRQALQQLPELTDSEIASEKQVSALRNLPEAQGILLSARWLSRLAAMPVVTEYQKYWVAQQENNPQILSAPLLEHPEKTVPIIDVRALARRTQSLWKIREGAASIQRDWEHHSLDWQALANIQVRRALLSWLGGLQESDALSVASEFEVHGLAAFSQDTEVLGKLALASHSASLYERLWSLPADAHVYQTLQTLGASGLPEDTIKVIDALRNPKLVSQGYQLLAKYHAQQPQAQKQLIRGLADEAHQWQAAAAIRSVKAPDIRTLLSNALHESSQKPGGALQWARKGLAEEAAQ